MTKQEKIEEHEQLAAHFAKESFKFKDPISNALSGLSEAHQHYADALRTRRSRERKAGGRPEINADR